MSPALRMRLALAALLVGASFVAAARAPSAAAFDAAFDRLDALPRAHDDQALQRARFEELTALLPADDALRELRLAAMRCGEDIYRDAVATAVHARALLARTQQGTDLDPQVRARYCLGNALAMQRQEQAAAAEYTQAIALASDGGLERLLGEGLELRASALSSRGEQAAALLDLMQAQQVYERAGLSRLAEGNTLGLAAAYRRMGEHDKALEYLQRSEKSARAGGDVQVLYTALLQLGYLQYDRSDAAASLVPLQQALDLAERHGLTRDAAIARIALAATHVLGGEHARALQLLAQAQAGLQALHDGSSIDLLLHLRRGQALAGLGRHREALQEYAQVLAELSGSDNLRYRLMVYRARAASLEAVGQHHEALAEYRRVLDAETALERITLGQQEKLMRHQFNVGRRELEHRRLAEAKALQEQRLQAQLRARRWQHAAMAASAALLVLLAALGLQQLRRSRRLHTMAMTDALTGVANRRSLERFATQAIRAGQARGHPLCVLAIDVDHFKHVNDRYGHAAGDAVLRRVAETCQQVLRKGDVLGRTGGEEFVAVLPGTALAAAHAVAERVLEAMAMLDLHAQAPGLRVTVSIGIAEYRSGDGDIRGLVQRADAALYLAKQNGRNRIETDDGRPAAHAPDAQLQSGPATAVPQPGVA